MRIAHSIRITPHKSGLYETAREIVAAERKLGVDAWMVDPLAQHAGGYSDRGAPYAETLDADIIVDHSGLSKAMVESGLPVIHCRHGRPRSTFLMESRGGPAVYTHVASMKDNPQYRQLVTFWPEHKRHWQFLWGRLVHVVPPCVDLDAWTIDGPNGYQFHGKGGDVNIVCADIWRDDTDPFEAIHEFIAYAQTERQVGVRAKLHLYGNPNVIKPLQVLLNELNACGFLGEVLPWVKGLDNVYRAANVALTCNTIATRSVREANACGCPVARNADEIFQVQSRNRQAIREHAERHYDPENTAKRLLEICEGALCPT